MKKYRNKLKTMDKQEMKFKLSHTALYAKGWYESSDDIFEDLKIALTMDGFSGELFRKKDIWENELSKSFWKKYKKHLDIEKSKGAKLYWVETHDHDEDWFIVAQDYRSAKQFHNDYEGYGFDGFDMNCESGNIRAIPIFNLSPELYIKYAEYAVKINGKDENVFDDKFTFHAQIDMLEELGAKIISETEPRIVKFDDIEFKEGGLQAQINHINNMHVKKDLN